MNQIFIKGVNGELFSYDLANLREILNEYCEKTGIPTSFIRATQNSRPIKEINPEFTVILSLKVCGGKGGFGSLLRGQGLIARVDNFEACRDLNGRRIRDVNNEIRLTEWKAKQQRAKEAQDEEKKEPDVSLPVKRPFPIDRKYKNDLKNCIQGVKSALFEGLKKKKL